MPLQRWSCFVVVSASVRWIASASSPTAFDTHESELLSQRRSAFERRSERTDGAVHTVLFTAMLLMLATGALLVWHTQRRVRAERAAQETFSLLRSTMENVSQGVAVFDDEAAAGRLERALRRAARLESAAAACRHVVDGHPRRRREARRHRTRLVCAMLTRCRAIMAAGGSIDVEASARRWRGPAGARPAHAGRQLHRHLHGRDCAEALRNRLSRPGDAAVVHSRRRRRRDRHHQRKRQHRIVEPAAPNGCSATRPRRSCGATCAC